MNPALHGWPLSPIRQGETAPAGQLNSTGFHFMIKNLLVGLVALCLATATYAVAARAADTTKIVLIAGHPSHGPGEHEFNAGCKLLCKCLAQVPGIEAVVVTGGWPKDESVFDGAKALIFFMDGGGGHPMIQGDHLAKLQKLVDKGVGLACLHYAVEVPKGEPGDKFLDWLGGYYETGYSTNPHWKAEIRGAAKTPDHLGREALRHRRRVVFQHALPSRDERRHANHRGQARRPHAAGRLGRAPRPVQAHPRGQGPR